jgi:hypothetical protein
MNPDWSVTPEPVPYAKLGDPQSLNLYAYVDNDPSNHADPDVHGLLFWGMAASPDEGLDPSGKPIPQPCMDDKPAPPPTQDQSTTVSQQEAQNQDPNQTQNSSSSSSSKSGGRVNSPAQGEPPDTTKTIPGNKPGETTERTYGPDGRAAKDVDRGHDHGAGDPHAHDWDWSKARPRGPGRPLTPEEKAKIENTAKKIDTAARVGAAIGATIHVIIETAPYWVPALAF